MGSASGLGRSNTYAGRSKLRDQTGALINEEAEADPTSPDATYTAAGGGIVRRHVSLHAAKSAREPAVRSTRTGKGRSASSSLTIDTAARQGSPGEGSGQTSPLTRSPISGNPLGRTPWSPTAEEAAKFISQKTSIENTREAFQKMDMSDDRNSIPSSAAGKRLPPLTTSFNSNTISGAPSSAGAANNGYADSPAIMPYRGPSSAAAFVRPIGGFNSSQSRMFEEQPNRNIPLHSNGAATAAVGSGASNWLQQKALIAGDPQASSALKSSNSRRRPDIEEPVTIDEETRSYATDSPPDFNQPLPYPHQSLNAVPFMSNPQASMPNYSYDPPAWMSGLHTNALAAMAQSQANAMAGIVASPAPPGPNNGHNFSWPLGSLQQLDHSNQQQRFPQQQQQQQNPTQQRPNLASLNTAQFMPPSQSPHLSHLWQNSQQENASIPSPLDVQSMAMAKGWNPPRFDCKPKQAKFCVIKSYTEDDIHKSIKYEIWSSTKLGNQRLDRVFKEGSPYGPVYLLFSVNGSGHFAGIAEMLTPVDESVSSNVWTDSKWKGIFKLRWIYIKDVPNHALRHLRLSNTQENKPVTSSRDTQEVPYDIGCEMLRIITQFNSKTSLLQDFAFYELKSSQLTGEQPASQPPVAT